MTYSVSKPSKREFFEVPGPADTAVEKWNLVIRSSMNLNKNKRFEQFDIDDCPKMAAFFLSHVQSMPIGFTEREIEEAFNRAMSDSKNLEKSKFEAKMQRRREKMAMKQAEKKIKSKFGVSLEAIMKEDEA